MFIHHSDCEGVWSAEDAESMLHSLERLTPFLKKDKEMRPYDFPDEEYFLVPLWEHCSEEGEDILFF